MKTPKGKDLDIFGGADNVERKGDHSDSPYYKSIDFYNMESSDSLSILTGFKTYQQTCEWSCGPVCAMMVLNWYGRLGDHNEKSLSDFRSESEDPYTNLEQMIEIFEGVGGFELFSQQDCKDPAEYFTLKYVRNTLKSGTPIMVAWSDWGGHWQVIIGYDTMGTKSINDDVLIMADPYDTTDHNQDGYYIYPAQRFMTMFSYYSDSIGGMNDRCFLVATPK